MQREVARRMAAGPGTADYSSFSVLCSSVYKVIPLKVLKASSFYPSPMVDSQGVRLEPLPRRFKLPGLFYPLVRSLFSGRRKTIRNTLTAYASSVIMGSMSQLKVSAFAREAAEEVLGKANVSGDRRPETLEIGEFAALAAFLEETVTHGS